MLFSVAVVSLEDETLFSILRQVSDSGLFGLSAEIGYLIRYEVYFYYAEFFLFRSVCLVGGRLIHCSFPIKNISENALDYLGYLGSRSFGSMPQRRAAWQASSEILLSAVKISATMGLDLLVFIYLLLF